MNTLLLNLKLEGGFTKKYRFGDSKERIVIGHSRKSDVRLAKGSAQNIEGILELEERGWVYHSFSMNEKVPLVVPLATRDQAKFFIGTIEVTAQTIQEKPVFNDKATEGELGEQLVLIYFQNRLFHSAQGRVGQTLQLNLANENLSIPLKESRFWTTEIQGSFEIRQKTLPASDPGGLVGTMRERLRVSKSDQMQLVAMGIFMAMGILSVSLAPKSSVELAQHDPPKVVQQSIVKLQPPTEKVKQAARQIEAQSAPASKDARMNRIQNLTASIASSAGKFLNKVRRGPAAIGPNGSMNAPALGVARLGGSKTDWNAMAGSNVSGQVGGAGVGTGSGNSRLAGQGIGSSGVNLLEQESEVSNGLDRELIAEHIRKNIGHILYCYERSLSANPNLYGKVAVRFVIGASGAVESQKIGETTLREAKVESCILEKVSHWKFPNPKGGVQVVVTYPFLFKTTN